MHFNSQNRQNKYVGTKGLQNYKVWGFKCYKLKNQNLNDILGKVWGSQMI